MTSSRLQLGSNDKAQVKPPPAITDTAEVAQGDSIAARHGPAGQSYSANMVPPIELWVRRRDPAAPDPPTGDGQPQSPSSSVGQDSSGQTQQAATADIAPGSLHASQLGLPGWQETVLQFCAAQSVPSHPDRSSQQSHLSLSSAASLSVDFQHSLRPPGISYMLSRPSKVALLACKASVSCWPTNLCIGAAWMAASAQPNMQR